MQLSNGKSTSARMLEFGAGAGASASAFGEWREHLRDHVDSGLLRLQWLTWERMKLELYQAETAALAEAGDWNQAADVQAKAEHIRKAAQEAFLAIIWNREASEAQWLL